ncbi:hypothetical protein Emag_001635 [Eimeria magna]
MSYFPSQGAPGAPGSLESPGAPPGGPTGKYAMGPLEGLRPQQPASLFGIGGGEIGCGVGGIGFGLGVTVDWQQLAGVSYRRQTIFSMLWNSPRVLENSVVAATPWGGPIAAVRSEKIFQPATNKLMPELQFFTARGRLALVCVFADSVVRTFSPAGEKLHFFSLGERIKSEGGIIQATVGKAGIAVITSKNQVYVNQAFDKASLAYLPTPVLRGPPLSICFITGPPLPPLCQGGPSSGPLEGPPIPLTEPRLLIATEEGALLLAERTGCNDLRIPDGPFVALAASRSGRFVAAVSNTGALQVLSVEGLSVRLAASASLERSRRVRQIAWCGDDCLGVYVPLTTPSGNVQHLVLLGGPGSEWLPLDFGSGPRGSGGGVVMVEEVDGLRVVTTATAELIQRVSAATESVFGVGSCDPPAMLCYALERLYAQDAAAEESLRAIKPELAAAAAACCEAATLELRLDTASFLLAAAAFGRRFLDDSGGPALKRFIRACRDIRICASLKEAPLDMPLTVAQLRSLTLSKLVRRIAKYAAAAADDAAVAADAAAAADADAKAAPLVSEHILLLPARRPSGLCRPPSAPVGFPDLRVHRLVSPGAKISRCTSLTDEELTEVVCSRMQAAAKLPTAAAAAAAGDPAATLAQSFFEYAAHKTAQQQRLQQLQQHPLPFARLALCAAQAGSLLSAAAAVAAASALAKVPLATRKAAEAADSDLLLQCIAAALAADADSADGRVDMSQLVEALHEVPAAQSAFEIYCNQTGQLELPKKPQQQVLLLLLLQLLLDDVKETQLFAAVAHSETLAALELLSIQRDLEVKANTCGWLGGPHKFVGLSVMQTIRQLILKGCIPGLRVLSTEIVKAGCFSCTVRMEFGEADALKKTFKISDPRYWRCKIDALADGMHFEELAAFAQFRTSPIGYEPFVEACMRKGNRELALQLVYKVKDLQSRAQLFSALGREDEAAATLRQGPQQVCICAMIVSSFFFFFRN